MEPEWTVAKCEWNKGEKTMEKMSARDRVKWLNKKPNRLIDVDLCETDIFDSKSNRRKKNYSISSFKSTTEPIYKRDIFFSSSLNWHQQLFFCIRCQTLHGVPHGLYKKSAGKYITNRFLTLCGCGGNIDECESRQTEVFSTSNQWTLSMRWCTANTQWVQNHLRMFYFIVLIFHLYCR